MKIVITIDERGNPKVEIVKEDVKPYVSPEERWEATIKEAKAAANKFFGNKDSRVSEKAEEVKSVKPVDEIKDIVKENKFDRKIDFRENYTYEALKEHSKMLMTYQLSYTKQSLVYKPLVKCGYFNSGKQFIDFYNSGWITFGKANPFEMINKSVCDITFFYDCIAWKDESRRLGFLLVEIRGKFILLHIKRNG